MTRNAIRLANLKHLVAEYGTITALAEASGTSEKYLGQLLNEAPLPSGNHRKIGDHTVTKIETGCQLPVGWMDIDHNAASSVLHSPMNRHELELIKAFREGGPAKRRALLAVARI